MTTRRSFPHPLTVLTTLAVAVGIIARWYRLGSSSLWFDEGYTAWVVSLPVHRLLSVIQVDTAPPLHYLLLRGWTLALGRSETAVRSLSAACATMSLLLLIPIARRLLNDPVATAIAVTLFSLGYLQITYSHEARLYTLMTFLALAAFATVLRAIDQPGVAATLLVALVWSAGLYTNNLMVLYVSAIALSWLILPGPTPLRRRLVDLLTAGAVALLLFAPWIPSMLRQAHAVQSAFWIVRPTTWSLVRTLAVLSGFNEQGIDLLPQQALAAGSGIIAVAIVVGLSRHRSRRSTVALSTIALGPVLVIFVLSRIGKPIFVERAFLASTAFLPLLLALPATFGRWPARITITLAIAIAVVDVRSWHKHWSGEYAEDWRGAIACAAGDGPQAHIVFVANEGEMLYDYYARGSDYSPSPLLLGAPRSFFANDPPRTMVRVLDDADLIAMRRAINASSGERWTLVESHASWADPQHRVLTTMSSVLRPGERDDFNQVTVYHFRSR